MQESVQDILRGLAAGFRAVAHRAAADYSNVAQGGKPYRQFSQFLATVPGLVDLTRIEEWLSFTKSPKHAREFRRRIRGLWSRAEKADNPPSPERTGAERFLLMTRLEDAAGRADELADLIDQHEGRTMAVVGPRGQARERQVRPPKPRRRPGRQPLEPARAARCERLLREWQRAREAGLTRKAFCDSEGTTVDDLERCRDWYAQQKKRGRK